MKNAKQPTKAQEKKLPKGLIEYMKKHGKGPKKDGKDKKKK
jgi:hypothetical protein